jgi:hypothetical protein
MLGRAFDEQPGRKNQEIRGNVEYLQRQGGGTRGDRSAGPPKVTG